MIGGFFFQAEDGIRDIGVTGVQTCALPIYGAPLATPTHDMILGTYFLTYGEDEDKLAAIDAATHEPTVHVFRTAQEAELRSEERRVGKECRSRWSPYH